MLYIVLQPAYKIWRMPELRKKTTLAFESLSFMLPQSWLERWTFALVCITAGVCEEYLFRGFVVDYFRRAPYDLPLAAAALASVILFGAGHMYQGVKGALSTVVMGFLFVILVLGFQSLWPAIVLHAMIDLRVLILIEPQ